MQQSSVRTAKCFPEQLFKHSIWSAEVPWASTFSRLRCNFFSYDLRSGVTKQNWIAFRKFVQETRCCILLLTWPLNRQHIARVSCILSLWCTTGWLYIHRCSGHFSCFKSMIHPFGSELSFTAPESSSSSQAFVVLYSVSELRMAMPKESLSAAETLYHCAVVDIERRLLCVNQAMVRSFPVKECSMIWKMRVVLLGGAGSLGGTMGVDISPKKLKNDHLGTFPRLYCMRMIIFGNARGSKFNWWLIICLQQCFHASFLFILIPFQVRFKAIHFSLPVRVVHMKTTTVPQWTSVLAAMVRKSSVRVPLGSNVCSEVETLVSILYQLLCRNTA